MPILADQTNITRDESALKTLAGASDRRWWSEDDAGMTHHAVWSVASQLYENLRPRRRRNLVHAMQYDNVDLSMYSHGGAVAMQDYFSMDGFLSYRTTVNVIRNCINTAASMIAKNRPKPLFLSDGGDFKTWNKGQKLTKYVAGVIEDMRLYSICEKVFTDACVYGTGAIKLFSEDGKIKAEWVNINEVLVDDLEGLKEKPSQIHQRKWVGRDELAARFPDSFDKIKNVSRASGSTNSVSDLIPVVESWHLRSSPDSKDGRHSITIENETLFSEQYDKDYYPIVFFRWYHGTAGFWGVGIAHELDGIQNRINRTHHVIDTCHRLLARPYILSPKTAQISTDELASNLIGRIVEYLPPDAPQVVTPAGVPPELYQYVADLEQKAYQIVGINEGMASGQKPPDVQSRVAIREATDIASGRFQVVGQRWESFHIELARIIVDLSKDLFAGDSELTVKVKSRANSLEAIRWSDVDMNADQFKIQVFEISALPSTPQGRLDTITEWLQAGWIQKEQAMSLLNVPDLDRFSNVETSTLDLVQAVIGRIKEEDVYDADTMAPIPQMNLSMAMALATQEKVLAKLQGVPDSVLDKLDSYIVAIDQTMKLNAPPQAGPPPGPPGPPGAPPGQGGTMQMPGQGLPGAPPGQGLPPGAPMAQ